MTRCSLCPTCAPAGRTLSSTATAARRCSGARCERLKRLRLGGLLPTLPDRATHARQAKLSPLEFLELLLQDEIDRRNSRGLQQRLAVAGFEEEVTPESITWDSPVSYDGPRVRELFGLHWLTSRRT